MRLSGERRPSTRRTAAGALSRVSYFLSQRSLSPSVSGRRREDTVTRVNRLKSAVILPRFISDDAPSVRRVETDPLSLSQI